MKSLLQYLRDVKWGNLGERALWTFIEGFLLAIPIINAGNIEEFINESWKLVLAGAVGAGLSAVKTLIIDVIKQHNEVYKKLNEEIEEIESDEYGDLEEYFEDKSEVEKNNESK